MLLGVEPEAPDMINEGHVMRVERKVRSLLAGEGDSFTIDASVDAGVKPALFTAIENGFVDVTKMLLDVGADVEKRFNGSLPIFVAARIVELLISRGADIANGAALLMAARNGHSDTHSGADAMAHSADAVRWRPVTGLSSSDKALRLRRDVARLVHRIHEKVPVCELEKRAIAPEFLVREDEWFTSAIDSEVRDKPMHVVVRMPTELLRPEDSEDDPDRGFRGYVRVSHAPEDQHERRYLEQVGSVLFVFTSEPTTDHEREKLSCGVVELHPVSHLRVKRNNAPCDQDEVELVASHQRWQIVFESPSQYRRSMEALSQCLDESILCPKIRRLLQTVDTRTEASGAILPSSTVGALVAQAFTSFAEASGAEGLLPYISSEYVLQVTGSRDFLLDRSRPLKQYMLVNEHLHRIDPIEAKKPFLRLTLVHESRIYGSIAQGRGNSTAGLDDAFADIQEPTLALLPSNETNAQARVPGIEEQGPRIVGDRGAEAVVAGSSRSNPLHEESLKAMRREILLHPLSPWSAIQECRLWTYRELFQDLPEALPRIVQGVDWSDDVQVKEALLLL